MTYTPTTDEVDTGFTTFAWKLEQASPGIYGVNSGFESYAEVCAGFRRWLAELERRIAERAWEEGYWQGINGHTGPGNPYQTPSTTDRSH